MVRKKNNKVAEPIITDDSKSSLKYIKDLTRYCKKDPKLMARKKNEKAPEPIVRIITEDSKSSLEYIDDLIRYYEKDPKLYLVYHVGSSPRNIQDESKRLLNDDEKPVQKIFCVFDKDSHDAKGNHYTNLLSYAKDNDKVIAINSVPCFEYWLLLHFIYTCSPFENADAVQKKLKERLPHYDKGRIDFHKDFKEYVDTAFENAKKSIATCEKEDRDNPMTLMVDLVQFLKQ